MDDHPTNRRGRTLFETHLPDTGLGVRAVRHAALRVISAYPNADKAGLVISELASNAAVHADCPCVLGIYECESYLLIQVQDSSDDQPSMGPLLEGNFGESGRGLRIVQAVSRDFGVERLRPSGKIVWATV